MKPRQTEEEWLEANTVVHLDLYRSTWNQFRKWRLFGVACCRRAMLLGPDARFEILAEAAEQFADGTLSWEEVKKKRRILTSVRKELGERFGTDEVKHDIVGALERATRKKPLESLSADQQAYFAYGAKARPDHKRGCETEELVQVQLARDIFGNPFRPIAFDSDWRTSTTVALAKQMYDSRDFSAMPILADALQDAGCENDDVLNHCRDAAAVHVRGCWVVDLVLGKS